MARPKRRVEKQEKPTIAIIGEGESEKAYFNQLKSKYRNVHFRLEPDLPSSSDIAGIEKKAIYLIKKRDFDMVLCHVDKDVIYRSDEARKKFYQVLDKYRRKKNSNIHFFASMPCFELWFLFHFTDQITYCRECPRMEKQLKEYFPNYEKKPDIIKNLYEQIKDKLDDAKKRSRQLRIQNEQNQCGDDALCCDVDLMIDRLDKVTR